MKEERASDTALLVQQAVLYTATRWSTAHLVTPDSRDASIRFLSRLPRGRRYLDQLDTRLPVALKERMLIPGICIHHAVRKKWVEEQVREAIAQGATQYVNLGAGFDTLALRLASEGHDLRLIEVDHPATQRAKDQALHGEEARGGVELLPVDFTKQALVDRLPQSRQYDPERPTVVVCEGVLPYLDDADARGLFRSLRELFGVGTRVVFTFIGRQSPTGRQPFGPFLRVFLAVTGEGMRLRLDPEEVRSLLSDEGVRLDSVSHTTQLIERYGAPAYRGDVHDLELMATATVT